jgi:hypothetical protein
VIGVEADGEDFFTVLSKEYGNKGSQCYDAEALKVKSDRVLESVQFKVVSELATQAQGMYSWLNARLEEQISNQADPAVIARLRASLANLEPLVGYFSDAMRRVEGKYPHLSARTLREIDSVYDSILECADDVREDFSLRDRRRVGYKVASVVHNTTTRDALRA